MVAPFPHDVGDCIETTWHVEASFDHLEAICSLVVGIVDSLVDYLLTVSSRSVDFCFSGIVKACSIVFVDRFAVPFRNTVNNPYCYRSR